MNTNKLTFGTLAAMAVALAVALLVSSVAVPVSAALTCETKSGNAPGGQQDKPIKDDCNGNKAVRTPNGNEPAGLNR
jgi:hypothetical protein